MKSLTILICILSATLCRAAQNSSDKPKLTLASDGFPYGHSTPEGAACDMARAFIKRDVVLFTNTCVRLYCGGVCRTNYQCFLEAKIASIREEAARKQPSPGGPKAIGKVFAARHLRLDGPSSYGYAAFGFEDVAFVDVGMYLYDGHRALTRTLVIKDRDGKWYTHPAPSVSPLLSMGLNEESASTQDFSEAYNIQK